MMTQETAIAESIPRISDGTAGEPSVNTEILVSVVMPCLNEARTLAACIERATAGCEQAVAKRTVQRASKPVEKTKDPHERAGKPILHPAGPVLPEARYEIIIADNGSTDGSPELAEQAGARVVAVEQRGYGAALLGGIAAARGKYVVMGDADGSYDFGEIPRFVAKLEEGYDLVMGNRFAGGIEPGAMPWHHRYIGNPVLSGIGRLLFRPGCRDFHCGLRAFDQEKIIALRLESLGMEFATEIVIRAARERLRIVEIPIVLHPDGRERPPHLRSFRDGWRHLRLMVGCFVAYFTHIFRKDIA